jgi:hypothetical protein
MTLIEQKIACHRAFWEKAPVERPLVGFRIGDYLFANKYEAALPLLQEGLTITPDMLDVDSFLDDYERMYQESLEIEQDTFWTASPFTAIPWMEAILGCNIRASEASFTSEPWLHDFGDLEQVALDEAQSFWEQNAWLAKYGEFVEKLVAHSRGRFPVSQPIMRGPSDMLGALRGQTNLVFDCIDNTEQLKQLGKRVTSTFLRVIQQQWNRTPTFHGGYAIGFYHLWCPGPCIWFQEDLAALLSPGLYREFLAELDVMICQAAPYTLCHLHPTAFFILDDLLQIDRLMTIQINKDLGGPSIEELLPVFRKVLQQKRLVVWGDLDEPELDIILKELPYQGLYLHIVAPTVEVAKNLMRYISARKQP